MAFRIIRADLTRVQADAIVNPANPEPRWGGGTDWAIYQAAGMEEMLEARQAIGPLNPGQVAVTEGFALPARWVIHAVSPFWQGGTAGEAGLLRQCYDRALQEAVRLRCGSVAFPLLAAGTCGFPRAEALEIAVAAFSTFLKKEEMEILLVVFDGESFELSGRLYEGIGVYISRREAEQRLAEEYGTDRRNRAWNRELKALESLPMTGSAVPPARRKQGLFGGFRRKKIPESEEVPKGAPTVWSTEEAADFDECFPSRAPSARSLDDVVREVGETFQQSLLRHIDARGMTDVEVYKRANLDRKLFSKIRSNPGYQPKKQTAVALALALRLNLDETRDLLARAGYALSPSSRFDLIVAYCIEQGVFDSYTINLALFEYDQPLLGA